jgi:hypothetical protein
MNRFVRGCLSLLKQATVFVLLFISTLAGGLFVFLAIATTIGFLPYSDRPGPGWIGAHAPSLEELRFYFTWTYSFLAPGAAFWGFVLHVFARLLGWAGTPRWAVRTIGCLLGLITGFVLTLAAGWYIAVASAVAYAGAIFGALFGLFAFPYFATTSPNRLSHRWVRAAVVSLVTIAIVAVLVRPFVPDRDAQSLDYVVTVLTPGTQQITAANNSDLTPAEIELLHSAGITGELHVEISGSYSNGSEKKARALIVVRGPLNSEALLRQPKAMDAVYVQDGNSWRIYPNEAPTIRKKIKLKSQAPQSFQVSIGE